MTSTMLTAATRRLATTAAFAAALTGIASTGSVAVAKPAPPSGQLPDTALDSTPPALSNSRTATFTFHATVSGASFTCSLDGKKPGGCKSPDTLSRFADGTHTFAVAATTSAGSDPSPATYSWTVDATPPSAPANLTGTTTESTVALTWSASSDAGGVARYDVVRNGTVVGSTTGTAYTDSTVTTGGVYIYTVRAVDTAGNTSADSNSVPAEPTAAYAPALTRSPYLTDLTASSVVVNFATDTSANTASVRYGTVDSTGICTLGTTPVAATRIGLVVGSVVESQWKALLNLPAQGTYCYRPFLASTDLLGANASPQFQTQVAPGATTPYSFAVFGDWGQTDANGANPDQAALLAQLAASGVRFALTTGDNAYPAGSEQNYGDLQQVAADTSGVFGPQFWGVPGRSIPVFPTIGNHGFARTDANHPHLAIWPQPSVVASSGGRYQIDAYPSVNGSNAANYPSAWYAFDAGPARFYVLEASWADQNTGTGTDYQADAASHWTSSSAEYQWLKQDLAAHPSGLKFAFFHYPVYSDQVTENSDTSLQGAGSLQGLLDTYKVNIAFNGHAHIYQRSTSGSVTYYTTGGGGALVAGLGTCSGNDRYGIGWSQNSNAGTACGAAPVPTSPAQVYHFLKVTVNGSTVTVAPTDSTGHTFDVQTYRFSTLPDTYIDSAPPPGTTSTSATFTFHSSSPTATFTCSVDGGAKVACTSPYTVTGLAEGQHTFSVTSAVGGAVDPTPATDTWTVDTTPPSAPSDLTVTTPTAAEVDLSWPAATDNTGVTGYDVYRDGAYYASVGNTTSYADVGVSAGASYSYYVVARDIAGNISTPSPTAGATVPAPSVVFGDDFESGTLNAWTSKGGLAPEQTTVHAGAWAVEGNTTTGATYAKKTLPSSYTDGYARVWFDVVSQASQVNLLRLRDSSSTPASLGYLYLDTTGHLGFHNDTTGTNTVSSVVPGPGWHALELHLGVGSPGTVEVWLDNVAVTDLSSSAATNTGTGAIGMLQIGETQGSRTYDVVFDDAAFGTSRLGM